MRKLLLLVGCIFLYTLTSFAATFTSVGVGNWNAGATWGNGGNTPGVDFPAAGDIANINTAVTIPGGFDAFALDVTINDNSTSSLTVTGTLTFTGVLTTGSLGDGLLTVNGMLSVEQGATMVPSTASFVVNGTYRHNYTTSAGQIYTATWNPGATLEFKGYTSNTATPTGLTQAFRNITWNCASQSTNIYFTGTNTFGTTLFGNLTIQSTAGSRFGFNHSGIKNLTINGNLTVASGAKFNMNQGSGSTTLHLKGDISIGSNDGVFKGGAGACTLDFNGVGGGTIQHITSSATLSTNVAWTIANPAVVDIAAGNFISSNSDFTLFAGATLRVGTTDGLVSGSSGGAVRANGVKIYEDDANIVYNGSTTQDLGDEWQNDLSAAAVNLEIATTAGAAVNNNNTGTSNVVGILKLSSGALVIGNSSTLDIQGDFIGAGGTFSGTNSSNLTFSGSGTFSGTLSFVSGGQTLRTLTLARSGTFSLGSPLTISGTGSKILFTSNGNLEFIGQTLTVNGNIQQIAASGALSCPAPFASSNLIIGGSGTLSSLPFCTTCGTMELNNLTLNRSSATYPFTSAVRINGILGLSQGTLSHTSGLTMVTGSTLSKSSGTTFSGTAPTASTSYNLSYVGDQTTSLELPSSSTALNNLTIAGNVVTDKAITINGDVSITSGSLDASTFDIAMAGATFAATGGTFTMNSANTFTFARSGTTTVSGSGLQFPNLTINSGATFSAPSSFSVSGTWLNNGTFAPGSGTVVFNGAAQSIDANGQAFNNVIIAGSSTKTLTNALDVNGNLTITSTLNVGSNNQINVAGLWINGGTFVPASGTVVFDGASQTITVGSTTFFNLTFANSGTKTLATALDVNGTLAINSSVTLDVSASNFGVSLAGNWTNDGTFVRRAGTVTLDGTSTQNLQGSAVTDFNNITVTNNAGPPAVRVESNQNLRGVLTLSTNTIFDADGSTDTRIFSVVSTADDPTVDGGIATLPTGASVSGSVTVQRFMSLEGNNGTRIYRYISSAVQNAAVSQIQAFIPVTGPFTGADTGCSGCGTAQSMFLYDETVVTDLNANSTAGDPNDGFINFPAAANTETFTPGRGYAIYVRGNTLATAAWSLRGPINSGNVTLPVSFTSTGVTVNDGWNLVGNPYPSTIDWDAGGWSRSNLNNTTYMLDNGLGSPVYATHVASGASANRGSRYIAAGQAFYVKSDGGAPGLQATEAVKAAGTQTIFFREATIKDIMRITLRQGTKADETVILFDNAASVNFDSQMDAHKLDNPAPMFNLATLGSSNFRYVINSLPRPAPKTEVPLEITSTTAGSYSLDFTEFESFSDANLSITLKDSFLGTTTDVRTTPSYQFQVTADAKSFGSDRFTVVFGGSVITGVEPVISDRISVYPNPVSDIVTVSVKSSNEVSAKIITLMGATLTEQVLQGGSVKKGTFNLQEQAEGLYILIVRDGTEVYKTRIIKKR